MLRDVAVTRITDGLGFRSNLAAKAILRLQEAQRDLESGKTLPKFLLVEDDPFTLLEGDHTVPLPPDFLRESDDEGMRYTVAGESKPTFVHRKPYNDALLAYETSLDTPSGPKIYVIRRDTIDFIITADQDYDLTWSYYQKADVLDTDIENAWLEHSPDWLIGEAGWRLAMDLRDQQGIQVFEALRKSGRAATLAEIFAAEEASGPFFMGLDN